MMQSAPKYSKIEIFFYEDEKKEFFDCAMVITGDYIIIIEDKRDEINRTETSSGLIFPLYHVLRYTTHKY